MNRRELQEFYDEYHRRESCKIDVYPVRVGSIQIRQILDGDMAIIEDGFVDSNGNSFVDVSEYLSYECRRAENEMR
ncbi:MAG: hypothetical protein ACXQTO_01205 [Candidatus Syntropharchaeales archaeon]